MDTVKEVIHRVLDSEVSNEELLEYLDSSDPTILYMAMYYIMTNRIKDERIIDKLLFLTGRLGEPEVIGYYKIGQIAMAALLKLGVKKKLIFKKGLDRSDKKMAIEFFRECEW